MATTSTAVHIVVMGISGSGKTTLAQALSDQLGLPFAEADEFHSSANIEKMRSGTPLTDEDRWPWLRSIRDWMSEHAGTGRGTVVTCSALKRSYRDLLSQAAGRVIFLEVDADPALIEDRMTHREGHFMPASLLPSQLATLESLGEDEDGAHLLNAGTPADLRDAAIAALTTLLGHAPRAQAPAGEARHRAHPTASGTDEAPAAPGTHHTITENTPAKKLETNS